MFKQVFIECVRRIAHGIGYMQVVFRKIVRFFVGVAVERQFGVGWISFKRGCFEDRNHIHITANTDIEIYINAKGFSRRDPLTVTLSPSNGAREKEIGTC